MKKLAIVLCLFAIPMVLFAQFRIGPAVYYGAPLLAEDAPDSTNDIGLKDFQFGLDTRFGLGLLDLGFNALVDPGNEINGVGVTYINLMPRIGLGLNLFILRVTLGVGPTFSIDIPEGGSIGDEFVFGSHAKASVALRLGKITLAVNYLLNFGFDFSDPNEFLNTDTTQGLFGISILF
jgi:hypothetical protein